MDTFEDTLTNEDYEQILRNLPPDSRDLSLSHEAERIREGFIGYHSYPNPFDCIENDTELMECFFGWLDEVVLNPHINSHRYLRRVNKRILTFTSYYARLYCGRNDYRKRQIKIYN